MSGAEDGIPIGAGVFGELQELGRAYGLQPRRRCRWPIRVAGVPLGPLAGGGVAARLRLAPGWAGCSARRAMPTPLRRSMRRGRRGLRHYDTAPQYGSGLAESRVGLGLKARPRDEYVLSTKIGKLLRPVARAPDGIFVGAPPFEVDLRLFLRRRDAIARGEPEAASAGPRRRAADPRRQPQVPRDARDGAARRGAGRCLQGADEAARGGRDRRVRPGAQRGRHQSRLRRASADRLHHAAGALHAARSVGGEGAAAALRAEEHLGDDRGAVRLRHPRDAARSPAPPTTTSRRRRKFSIASRGSSASAATMG